jgi:hypothetical protein
MNNQIEVTLNGKKSETLTRIMNGGVVTELEQNEATTRKLDSLKEKLTDKGQADFVKEMDKLSNGDLEDNVLGFAKEMERIEDERANHKELQAAKANAKVLNKGFTDTKKFAQLKMQFVLTTLKSRGVK